MLRAHNQKLAWAAPCETDQHRSRVTFSRAAAATIALICLLVVRVGYLDNRQWIFFGGLGLLLAAVGVWLKLETRRVQSVGWMVWQRLAATLLVFTVIEAGYRVPGIVPKSPSQSAAKASFHVVNYAEAQGDPHAFSEWWDTYSSEWRRGADLIQTPTPGGPVPYVFRPNTKRPFLHGEVSVNSLGLCDREVPLEKGDRYRIVVMGSSHTQCPPIEAGDTPWPAMLEQLIRERVSSDREIEVLNAGAAAYTMEHNLHRLQDVVLPLKPDLIITYFGYNEFDRYRRDFRLPKAPPKPQPRASVLLGKLDWRAMKWLADRSSGHEPLNDLVALAPRLAKCRLAQVYQEYRRIAGENGIPLVVCNFNMAVDEHSPDEVVRFYEQAFPDVRFLIEANRLNTAMLPLIFDQQPGTRLVDVQSGLNGAWNDEYVDLVHLSEVGKAKLAENVFRGIVDLLPSVPTPTSKPQLADRPDAATTRF